MVKISHGVLPTSTPDKVHFATLGQIRYIAQSQSVMHKPKVRKKSSTATFADDKITDTNVGQIFNSADNALSPDIFEKAEALPNIADEAEQPQSSPVDFFGSKSYERSICYVVDCSGSMKGLFGQVRQNLKQSISDLQADQYFYVIFFGDGQVFELASGQMVRAGNSAKSNAFKFIDSIDSKGKTNALEALKIAVKLRDHCQKCPGVIYFLTDGFELAEENSDQFTNETTGLLEQFAPDTKVNTIGFWVQPGDGEILNVIAEKTGGSSILINGSAEK
ncbi:MAG TPA: VWA domain-containing protein [Sedimentisphaerales bacterium]|nr:VWA domain-containing protein [Sedimentisphaerales bacterium]